jgi:hypothetical protein
MAPDEHLLIVSAITSSADNDQDSYLAVVAGVDSKVEISDASATTASVEVQVYGGRPAIEDKQDNCRAPKVNPDAFPAISALETDLGLKRTLTPAVDPKKPRSETTELRGALLSKIGKVGDWCTKWATVCRDLGDASRKWSPEEQWLVNVFWTLTGIVEANHRAPPESDIINKELRRMVLNRMCDLEWLSRNAWQPGSDKTSPPPSDQPSADDRPSHP